MMCNSIGIVIFMSTFLYFYYYTCVIIVIDILGVWGPTFWLALSNYNYKHASSSHQYNKHIANQTFDYDEL